MLARWSWIFALIGGGLLFAALATWFIGSWQVTNEVIYYAVAAAISLIAYVALDRERVGDTVTSRSFVHGSGASLLVIMAGAIAFGAYQLARRHDETWDWSKEQRFSISEHTRTVLAGLTEDVRVLGFFRNGSQGEHDLQNLMRLYQEQTTHVVVEYVDPLKNPRLAEQYDVVTDAGTVLLVRGEKQRRLSDVKEKAVTDGIVLLMSDSEHRICWSLGHGEPEPDDEFEPDGLGGWVVQLESANYQVTKSRIASEGIDRACEVLVIARPTVEPFPYELEAIAAYIAEGGQVLLLLEPFTVPGLSGELARYGLTAARDLVVDLDPKNTFMGVDDPSVVVLSEDNIQPHEITKSLTAAIVMPSSRSIVPAEPMADGLTADVILRSGPQSWAETTPDQPNPNPEPGVEMIGDIPLMVVVTVSDPAVLHVTPRGTPSPAPAPAPDPEAAAEAVPEGDAAPSLDLQGDVGRAVPADFAPKAGGRLVVVGDTDLLGNATLQLGNNKDLGLNALAWLVDEKDQIGERPPDGDKLMLTDTDGALTCLVSIVIVPGAAMLLALATLVRRRFL